MPGTVVRESQPCLTTSEVSHLSVGAPCNIFKLASRTGLVVVATVVESAKKRFFSSRFFAAVNSQSDTVPFIRSLP